MKNTFLGILLILLFACERRNEIEFKEPQPSEIENTKLFNKHYQGRYLSPDDSSSLIIQTNRIIKINRLPIAFSRNDIDSSFKGDKSDNKQIESALREDNIRVYRIDGDSIFSTLTVVDTIFTISDNNIVRYLKGAYFLNSTDDKITWKVHRLDLNKNKLSLSWIIPNDSLFNSMSLKDKSVIKDDSGTVTSYQIKPSKRELKRLIKDNSFEEYETWIKEK